LHNNIYEIEFVFFLYFLQVAALRALGIFYYKIFFCRYCDMEPEKAVRNWRKEALMVIPGKPRVPQPSYGAFGTA
jgi:hypothetical protein